MIKKCESLVGDENDAMQFDVVVVQQLMTFGRTDFTQMLECYFRNSNEGSRDNSHLKLLGQDELYVYGQYDPIDLLTFITLYIQHANALTQQRQTTEEIKTTQKRTSEVKMENSGRPPEDKLLCIWISTTIKIVALNRDVVIMMMITMMIRAEDTINDIVIL